jgi:hypothetical protein
MAMAATKSSAASTKMHIIRRIIIDLSKAMLEV